MTDKYREYLVAEVLTEGRYVTYRLLSRALKVNVNTAKQMLYDFHSKQNAKKPKSVHATYLFTGKPRAQPTEHTNGTHKKDGEDTVMESSPFPSSMPEREEEPAEEPVPVTSVVLVREEELEKKKSEFEEIMSIHIYSLGPGPIENMNMLSICNQKIAESYHNNDDPLERYRTYGCIHNPHIKRRTARYAPPAAVKAPAAAAKPPPRNVATTIKKEAEDSAASSRRGSVSEDTKSGRSTPRPDSSSGSAKKPEPKPKKSMSELFKSFAKTRPPKPKEESKESTPAQTEDEPMTGMSEDEAGEDDEPEVKFDEVKAALARKARQEREAKLRKMMEEDEDEPMEDAPTEPDSQDAPIDKPASQTPAETEAKVTVQGGRRRGRRKVMKKKTVEDEDGYIVTKEEAVWESFSEDEPEAKKPKPAPKSAAAKGKKGGTGKYGQGSIASFFKKS